MIFRKSLRILQQSAKCLYNFQINFMYFLNLMPCSTVTNCIICMVNLQFNEESCSKISSLKNETNDKQAKIHCLLMDAFASHYTMLVMQRAINRYCERSV